MTEKQVMLPIIAKETTRIRILLNAKILGYRILHLITFGLGEGIFYPIKEDWKDIRRPPYILESGKPHAYLLRLAANEYSQRCKRKGCPELAHHQRGGLDQG